MTQEEELQLCCAPKHGSDRLTTPFAQGGFIWGSNIRLALRGSATDLPDDPNRPDVVKLLGEVLSLPWLGDGEAAQYSTPPAEPCKSCGGTGEVVECEECDGTGTVDWRSGHHDYEHECKGCDGEGKGPRNQGIKGDPEECSECDGKGSYINHDVNLIANGYYLHGRYVAHVLTQLGAVLEVSPINGFLRFRTSGGQIGATIARKP